MHHCIVTTTFFLPFYSPRLTMHCMELYLHPRIIPMCVSYVVPGLHGHFVGSINFELLVKYSVMYYVVIILLHAYNFCVFNRNCWICWCIVSSPWTHITEDFNIVLCDSLIDSINYSVLCPASLLSQAFPLSKQKYCKQSKTGKITASNQKTDGGKAWNEATSRLHQHSIFH